MKRISFTKGIGPKNRLWFITLLLILIASCHSGKIISQKECFIERSPIKSSKYKKLNITSFGSWKSYLLEENSNVLAMLNAIKKKFPEDKELVDFVNSLEKTYLIDYDERGDYILGLSKNEILPEDEIYLFEYHDNGKIEYGVLVLNNCEIRKRFVDVSYNEE